MKSYSVNSPEAAARVLATARHLARLDEQPTQVPPDSVAGERQAIVALWQAAFG